MKFVYMIEDETLLDGAWTDPREAARRYIGFRKEPDPNLDVEEIIQDRIDKAMEMLSDTSDFPKLVKVPVNPVGSLKTFHLDRYHH